MAKCPVCKEYLTGFEWTKTKTGKNWLADTSGNWHDCPENVGKYQKKTKFIILKSKDYRFCDLCGRWFLTEEANKKYPETNYIDFGWHIKTFHPNGEILDEYDFMIDGNENRKLCGKVKRTKPYKLKGKIVY